MKLTGLYAGITQTCASFTAWVMHCLVLYGVAFVAQLTGGNGQTQGGQNKTKNLSLHLYKFNIDSLLNSIGDA